jgi:hypothetical protein
MPTLVIDASIARAAGGESATYRASVYCREFLKAVLKSDVKIVRTADIWAEWKRHRSKFSATWLTSMVARKRVAIIPCAPDPTLRAYPSQANLPSNAAASFDKDCHLLEAAKASDKNVTSLDDSIRNAFAEASGSVRWISQISWANPANPLEDVIQWVRDNLRDERMRKLGNAGRMDP